MKRKRGFSLVEVVVAIAIIVIASSITFMVVLRSNNVLLKARIQVYAANEAENVLKSYNASIDEEFDSETFIDYMKFIHNETKSIEFCNIDSENKTITVFYTTNFTLTDETNYSYKVILSTNQDSPNLIVSNKDNKLFYRFGV